jgi:hypothetical protein
MPPLIDLRDRKNPRHPFYGVIFDPEWEARVGWGYKQQMAKRVRASYAAAPRVPNSPEFDACMAELQAILAIKVGDTVWRYKSPGTVIGLASDPANGFIVRMNDGSVIMAAAHLLRRHPAGTVSETSVDSTPRLSIEPPVS